MTLTPHHKKLLKILQADGRIPNAALAKKVNMSTTACWNHTNKLLRDGYIKEIKAILDPDKLDLPVLVTVGVVLDRSTPDSFDDFEKAVRKISAVQECLLLAGEFDYWLKIRVKDVPSFNKLHANSLLKLPGVRQLRTFFVLNEIKASQDLPIT